VAFETTPGILLDATSGLVLAGVGVFCWSRGERLLGVALATWGTAAFLGDSLTLDDPFRPTALLAAAALGILEAVLLVALVLRWPSPWRPPAWLVLGVVTYVSAYTLVALQLLPTVPLEGYGSAVQRLGVRTLEGGRRAAVLLLAFRYTAVAAGDRRSIALLSAALVAWVGVRLGILGDQVDALRTLVESTGVLAFVALWLRNAATAERGASRSMAVLVAWWALGAAVAGAALYVALPNFAGGHSAGIYGVARMASAGLVLGAIARRGQPP
jgi:hypothetical protein